MAIGTKQRTILTALKAGGELRVEHGEWSLYETNGKWATENRERCMRLFEQGYIMADSRPTPGGRWRYVLTRKGEEAV
jgi:hypothetical protein